MAKYIGDELKAKYKGITRKYVDWVLSNTEKIVPDEAFPYISEPPVGRNFSNGDLLYWYLTKGVPLALNGDTGIGKSTCVTYFAKREGKHLIEVVPTQEETASSFIVKEALDEDGSIIFSPCGLTLSCIYEGMFFLDEVTTMDGDKFTGFNRIFQGNSQQFRTQYGMVNLDWKFLKPIIGGNFHDKNPDFDAASRYRFVWVEFPRPEGELLKEIIENRVLYEEGMPFGFKSGREPKKHDPDFSRSREYLEIMTHFSKELYSTLVAYADINRGMEQNGHKRSILSPIRRLLNRNKDSEKTLQGYMAEAKEYMKGRPWKLAPAIPVSAPVKVVRLFHPEMEPADYQRVLRDIYVNPAIATTGMPLNEAASAYTKGMNDIVVDKLKLYFNRIKETIE